MNDFNPGEGWREVDLRGEGHLHAIYQLAQYDRDTGELVRAWAETVPVPPLPTEPWTVIRGTMPSGASLVCILHENGQWWDSSGIAQRDVTRYVTGFEVLAEPRKTDLAEFTSDPLNIVRRQTAKAVLDRVLSASTYRDSLLDKFDDIAREFGVDQ